MNPLKMLKSMDLSGLTAVLDSIIAHLERIEEETKKQNKLLETISENGKS